jgi:hypothetical protein
MENPERIGLGKCPLEATFGTVNWHIERATFRCPILGLRNTSRLIETKTCRRSTFEIFTKAHLCRHPFVPC